MSAASPAASAGRVRIRPGEERPAGDDGERARGPARGLAPFPPGERGEERGGGHDGDERHEVVAEERGREVVEEAVAEERVVPGVPEGVPDEDAVLDERRCGRGGRAGRRAAARRERARGRPRGRSGARVPRCARARLEFPAWPGRRRSHSRFSHSWPARRRLRAFDVVVVPGFTVDDLASVQDLGAIGLLDPGAGPETSGASAQAGARARRGAKLAARGDPRAELLIDVRRLGDREVPCASRGSTSGSLTRGACSRTTGATRSSSSGPGYEGLLTSDSTRIPGSSRSSTSRRPRSAGTTRSARSRRTIAASRLLELDERIDENNGVSLPATILVCALVIALAVFVPAAAVPGFARRARSPTSSSASRASPRFWAVLVVARPGGRRSAARSLARSLRSPARSAASSSGSLAAYLVALGIDGSTVALSPFGPTQNSRYFGLSNLLETMLLVPALAGAALLFARLGWAAFAGTALLAFVDDRRQPLRGRRGRGDRARRRLRRPGGAARGRRPARARDRGRRLARARTRPDRPRRRDRRVEPRDERARRRPGRARRRPGRARRALLGPRDLVLVGRPGRPRPDRGVRRARRRHPASSAPARRARGAPRLRRGDRRLDGRQRLADRRAPRRLDGIRRLDGGYASRAMARVAALALLLAALVVGAVGCGGAEDATPTPETVVGNVPTKAAATPAAVRTAGRPGRRQGRLRRDRLRQLPHVRRRRRDRHGRPRSRRVERRLRRPRQTQVTNGGGGDAGLQRHAQRAADRRRGRLRRLRAQADPSAPRSPARSTSRLRPRPHADRRGLRAAAAHARRDRPRRGTPGST